MNTNTMELNMNEMATVNGGDLIDSLSRIGEAMIITHVGKEKERRSKPTVIPGQPGMSPSFIRVDKQGCCMVS